MFEEIINESFCKSEFVTSINLKNLKCISVFGVGYEILRDFLTVWFLRLKWKFHQHIFLRMELKMIIFLSCCWSSDIIESAQIGGMQLPIPSCSFVYKKTTLSLKQFDSIQN